MLHRSAKVDGEWEGNRVDKMGRVLFDKDFRCIIAYEIDEYLI
jgi:hypothetical protein